MSSFDELLEETKKHLANSTQNWLLGSGISFDAKIPLKDGLIKYVEWELEGNHKSLYGLIKNSLKDNSHIEHVLSQIGDYIALLDRTKDSKLKINDNFLEKETIEALYKNIVKLIVSAIRFGFVKNETDIDSSEVGTFDSPIVEIDGHLKFVRSLFKNNFADKERRLCLNFFTTNYDTLLEDAMSMEAGSFIDGFGSGGVSRWSEDLFSSNAKSLPRIFKLHGSVDWQRRGSDHLFRVRPGAKYFQNIEETLIYPHIELHAQ